MFLLIAVIVALTLALGIMIAFPIMYFRTPAQDRI
jgi:zinc transporter ZupT